MRIFSVPNIFFITFTLCFDLLFISTLTLYSSREQTFHLLMNYSHTLSELIVFISLYQFCIFTLRIPYLFHVISDEFHATAKDTRAFEPVDFPKMRN